MAEINEHDLIGALGDPALLLGDDDLVTAANPAAEALFGFEPGALSGVEVSRLVPAGAGDATALKTADDDVLTGQVHLAELRPGLRLMTARDVTAERRIASQLADAERIAAVGIWEWHVPTDTVTWSSEAFRLFGRDPATTVPTYELWLESIHPEDRDWVAQFVQDSFVSHRDYDFEHRVLHADGTIKHLHCRGQVILGADGEPLRLVGASQDVTERLLRQAEIASAAARQEAVLNAAGEGICGLDPKGAVTFANPAAAALLGTTVEELIGDQLGRRLSADDSVADPIAAAIAAGRPLRDARASFRRDDTERVPIAYHCSPISSGDELGGAVVTFEDASERNLYEEQLRFLADHDALTGLFNRRRFEEEVATQAVYADRFGGSLAVLLLDLDHFKDVNDTRGHSSGDQLIRSTAVSLRSATPTDSILARLGGDEFAVLLPAADQATALRISEELRAAVAEHLVLAGGERLRVTTSIGISAQSGPGIDAGAMLSDADVAMYDAKEAGRDRVAFYRPELGARDRMEARITWTSKIRRALDTDGFQLFAQPILCLDPSIRERRFEVLLRLPQPDGTLALPGAFLPVAERHGLIVDIDRWVVAKAIEIAAGHRDDGPPVRLEVNLSGHSMVDPDLPAYIADLLERSEAEPSQLIFEVTETAAIDGLREAQDLAGSLVELGCEFAIDDFGAGFGSFAYLKHLPTQYVKIDGDFIRRLPTSPNDQLVVKAIATIATGMGKRTIAEFVEMEETLELLSEYEIDFAQGYHTGRPGPIDDVIAASDALAV